jgi:hypothetical protein
LWFEFFNYKWVEISNLPWSNKRLIHLSTTHWLLLTSQLNKMTIPALQILRPKPGSTMNSFFCLTQTIQFIIAFYSLCLRTHAVPDNFSLHSSQQNSNGITCSNLVLLTVHFIERNQNDIWNISYIWLHSCFKPCNITPLHWESNPKFLPCPRKPPCPYLLLSVNPQDFPFVSGTILKCLIFILTLGLFQSLLHLAEELYAPVLCITNSFSFESPLNCHFLEEDFPEPIYIALQSCSSTNTKL